MSDNPLNSETVTKPAFADDQRTDNTYTFTATKLAETWLAESELIHPGILAIINEIEITQEYYHACGRW